MAAALAASAGVRKRGAWAPQEPETAATAAGMPVIWHQSLLAFVQKYHKVLSAPQANVLARTARTFIHEAITPEILLQLSRDDADEVQGAETSVMR